MTLASHLALKCHKLKQAKKNVTFTYLFLSNGVSQVGKLVKNLLANAGDTSDVGSISG